LGKFQIKPRDIPGIVRENSKECPEIVRENSGKSCKKSGENPV
jgi:hypothetical protein